MPTSARTAELSTIVRNQVAGTSVPPPSSLARLPEEVASAASYPFPLDARVGPRLRAKILVGEFVNFSDLLEPAKAENFKLSLKQLADGEVVVVKEQNTQFKQTVRSIQECDRAFATYVALYGALTLPKLHS